MKKGILAPISSLPSPYGIGTFGKTAFSFCDFLKSSRQDSWQILPLGVTSYGDSPYQSPSAYAINPYFIDLDLLIEDGLIDRLDVDGVDFGSGDKIDYEKLYLSRRKILKKATKKVDTGVEYKRFLRENKYWLEEYALFMAIKEINGGKEWSAWDVGLKKRKREKISEFKKENAELIEYYKKEQYLAFSQWFSLKSYANQNGIEIIGDMPIYNAYDSHDVWGAPRNYQLDKNLTPKFVAGVPPDAFTADGQLWGNPLYNFDKIKANGYEFWVKKLAHQAKLYDVIRIDHFRAFEAYFAIPYGKPAKEGKWVKAPGEELFSVIKDRVKVDIIAEDLGIITPAVRRLLRSLKFPNMRVLQFADFKNSKHEYLPKNYPKNCIAYTGTHDNDTTRAWLDTLSAEDKIRVQKIAQDTVTVFGLIKALMSSKADRVIIPIQDYLLQGGEGRINYPGKDSGNWVYRIPQGVIDNKIIIRTIRELSKR